MTLETAPGSWPRSLKPVRYLLKIRIINLGRHQVQLPARQNVCLCMLDMLRGPGTTGGVTTGSKLVIRGIPPTAMGAYPGQGSVRNHGLNLFRTSLQLDTYLAEGGFPMSHSRSRRQIFRRTHP